MGKHTNGSQVRILERIAILAHSRVPSPQSRILEWTATRLLAPPLRKT